MKIKFDSDDDLPLNKTMEILDKNLTIVVRAIFIKLTNIIPKFS